MNVDFVKNRKIEQKVKKILEKNKLTPVNTIDNLNKDIYKKYGYNSKIYREYFCFNRFTNILIKKLKKKCLGCCFLKTFHFPE